jgi:hypothetical protein
VAERKRVLGHSGSRVFERYYQDPFIGGLQEVVLARPSHAALYKEARKSRDRDPRAPKTLDHKQLATLCRNPHILQLRQTRTDLKNEMRSLAGTVKAAKNLYPELYQQHDKVCKNLQSVRKKLRTDAKAKMKDTYWNNMPVIEVDKQIKMLQQGKLDEEYSDTNDDDNEELDPPPPKYNFPERARLVEAFYGADAETLDGEEALARRIQVTTDMARLCKLSEPNRRGNRFDWDQFSEEDVDSVVSQEAELLPTTDKVKCPNDECIVCKGLYSGQKPRKFQRIDSLRRHLVNEHINRHAEGVPVYCTDDTCKTKEAFNDFTAFLSHAATCHDWDPKIKPQYLDRKGVKPLHKVEKKWIWSSTKS